MGMVFRTKSWFIKFLKIQKLKDDLKKTSTGPRSEARF